MHRTVCAMYACDCEECLQLMLLNCSQSTMAMEMKLLVWLTEGGQGCVEVCGGGRSVKWGSCSAAVVLLLWALHLVDTHAQKTKSTHARFTSNPP